MELAGGSKFKYLFRRIFPPKSEMVKNYNILKKHIVLLPFMYIYRLVYKSIKKSDVAKKEIKELKKYLNLEPPASSIRCLILSSALP